MVSSPAESGGASSAASKLPDMTPQLRQRLQKCFDHAGKLMQQEKYDYDYAHAMLLECVANDLANQPYLERFLGNLHRKHGKKRPKSLLAVGGGPPARMKKAVQKSEWREALRAGLEALPPNPWDSPLLRALAQVCEALHANESELRFLKEALESNPKDAETNRHCGRSLARMGQYDQAIACWHRVEELVRHDPDAQKMIAQLTLDRAKPKVVGVDELTPTEKARHEAIEKSAKGKGGGQPRPAEAAKPAPVALTTRQQLEHQLAQNPADVDAYLALAKLLSEEERHADAEQCLQKAVSASGNNPLIREQLEDAQLRRARQHLAIAEKQAQLRATPEAQQLVKQLREELNRMELDVFRSRKERHPTQKRYAFELGLRLKVAGNLREAVQCFDEATSVPTLRAEAFLELGECLQMGKKFDKALASYVKAYTESDDRQLDTKKKALHRGARLAEATGDFERAEKLLARLVELDSTYKEAAIRLAKVREKRDTT